MSEALEMAGRESERQGRRRTRSRGTAFSIEQSGGGVTLSGGEPLAQPEFCEALLDGAEQKRRIHTALDTSGLRVLGRPVEHALRRADLILYDLKMMDEAKHMKYTGVSNTPILENLKKLAAAKKDIAVRIPLMAGVNDDDGEHPPHHRFPAASLKTVKNSRPFALS